MKMQKTLVSGSKMFDAAGMDVGKLLGMDADQQIGAIADRLATMTNATERTAFATAMFGKAGAHLLPFLEGGSEGLAQLEQELQATGNAYSSMDASKVAIAADAIDRLKTTVSALFQQVAIQLSPAILDITNRFVEWANSGEGMGAKVKYGIDIVIQSAGGLMNAFQGVGTVFGWIGEMITGGLSHVNTNIEGVSNSTISLGTVFLSFGALINDVLGKVAGAFGYMFARIKTGMDVVILGVLMGVDKLVNAVQTAANKVIGLNNTVMRMAGNEAGVVDLFNTNDNGLDPFIKDMQEKTKKGFDEIGNVGPWEKYFQDNSKMLNGEIDKISEAQKPSSQLDQWWATVNSKMDEQAAQHENITQMEEEGLDLEKLKTKEKEKQEKIEQGGFLVSKFGRTAFGADSTFDKEGNKLFGNTAKEGSPGKDGQIVTELQEQTNYLRVLASKPQVASFA
jgi:hypothetical protein